MEMADKLAAEFSKELISWRAQTVTQDGKKALALAYIDARDVMTRLDEVCGVAGWQCEYPHANGKTICSIGIKMDGEWVWKADGAGDTDIEAEKGAISDAFKRAAVKWGIGRYLYAMDAVWVPCDSYKDPKTDKWKWKSFTADPWAFVSGKPARSVFSNSALRNTWFRNIDDSFNGAQSKKELETLYELNKAKLDEMKAGGNEHDLMAVDEIRTRYGAALVRIKEEENNPVSSSYGSGFAELNGR